MKKFGKMAGKALIFCAVMMLLCSFAYPLALTGASQLAMKEKANGNLIDKEGNPTTDSKEAVGSALVGQEFTEDYYLWSRPSAYHYNVYIENADGTQTYQDGSEFSGIGSGSNNYAPSNPELVERVEADMALFLEKNPDVKPEDIPTDLLTASGSGLDPHISPKAAEIQIPRIVAASGLEEDQVRKIIENHTTSKLLGVFGEETVNVVKVNIELGTAMGLLQN